MSLLTIYKASAGSGKTYQLTWNYLKMVFRNPDVFRHLLAVTFTNKATREMKARILSSLYLLSVDSPSVMNYREMLAHETGLIHEQVNKKAYTILESVLNSYTDFHISTIDKFFQGIIRGFTREIGLQAGYNLELNKDKILAEAVDSLIFTIGENPWLKEWLIMYANTRIENEKSWDPFREIFSLGREVFSESYQDIHFQIDTDSFENQILDQQKEIREHLEKIDKILMSIGQKALSEIERHALGIDDFAYGKSGVANHFKKLTRKDYDPGKRVYEATENVDKWVSKRSRKKDEINQLVEASLYDLLRQAVEFWEESKKEYQTAKAMDANIYAFGILNSISSKIREIANVRNLFMISDASLFLKRIIGNNDTPFIYEKAATFYENFMLDEFQDTSRYQWNNFAPLIDESLSRGNRNLIVGDVKQAIYRWRNSDWEIMASEIDKEFARYSPETLPLLHNWRSYENVVSFNNSIFGRAAGFLKQIFSGYNLSPGLRERWDALADSIYQNTWQEVPSKLSGTGGFVSAEFLMSKTNDDYHQLLEERLPEIVMDLQDRGVAARDITFLVRRGTEGRSVARILLDAAQRYPDYNFNLISNDSLYLDKNPAVSLLVSALKYLRNPDDMINRAFIHNEFIQYVLKKEEKPFADHDLFDKDILLKDFAKKYPEFDQFYTSISDLKKRPLFELVEKLISFFRLNIVEEFIPYIQAFQDIVLGFIRDETSDIHSFLDYWEKNKKSYTLNISEEQDAIRIMTIHKSKGLEFKTVVIPFCHWTLKPDSKGKDRIMWVDTSKTPFQKVGVMPVKYADSLKDTLFENDYYEETFHSFIDNLNLLYVAMTRAEKELFIISQIRDEKQNPTDAGKLLQYLINDHDPERLLEISPDDGMEGKRYTFGERTREKSSGLSEKEEFIRTIVLKEYPVVFSSGHLRKNVKNAYLSNMHDDMQEKIGYGTVMHEIFARIRYYEDIESAVGRVYREGKITSDEQRSITDFLKDKLNATPFTAWFDRKWNVRNEQDIALGSGIVLRPDRVMTGRGEVIILDYKFGKKRPEHEIQVKEYVKAVQPMVQKPVSAFVWYVNEDDDEIMEVTV